MKNKIVLLFLIFLLVFVNPVFAKQGNIKLLAVTEINGTYEGSIADLHLEIKRGNGRIFLETFPLTKFDTQISTRFAKEIACSYADIDCSKYDFFYTINADSPIIAGASAGSSISLLTISLLNNLGLDENIAITGTINSGGLIGPVGGLKEKIEAAKKAKISTVLIPQGGKTIQVNNETVDIKNFSKEIGINVVEVSTLGDAIREFTGKKIEKQQENITISSSYTDTMKFLATELCTRTEELKNIYIKLKTNESEKKARNLTSKGRDSFENGFYYSAASYCFGAGVEYSYLILLSENLTEEGILKKFELIKKSINNFNEKIKKDKIKTITDLEAYMVVKERLTEANDFLNLVLDNTADKEKKLHDLAYAIERLNSAKSWATFLDNRGKEFNLDEEVLRNSCKYRLSEAEERYQYVNLYYPASLMNTRKELDYAYNDLEGENYALCIFKASKAKANLDIILSVFYVDEEQTKNILKQKLEIVKRNLIKETQKNIFPILGYSYYEYATVLEDEDTYSSLLYSEYALEFSNLEVYFKEKSSILEEIRYKIDINQALTLIFGLIVGYLTAILIQKQKSKRKKRNNRIKISDHKPSRTSPAGKKR